MTDTMREAFEKWAHSVGLSVAPYGASYLDEKTHIAWITWQAKQSVPVVGDAVAWRWRYAQKSVEALATACFGKPQWESDKVFDGIPSDEAIQRALLKGVVPEYLYRKPTHSITAAELERLRKDAELKASEASIACEALQEIIDLLPGSSVAQAKLIAVAAMTKRAAIAAEGEKE